MEHSAITWTERLGSSSEETPYRCTFCDSEMMVDSDTIFDYSMRHFCCKRCRDRYYGMKFVEV